MSRSTYDVKNTYVGTGSLDTYTFSFKITAKAQLLVIEVDASGVETQRVLGTDTTYLSSVTFDATDGGGTVVLAANLTSGYSLIFLLADDAPTQPYELNNKTSFGLPSIENALDNALGAIQRLVYRGKQAFRIHDLDDEETFDSQLPPNIATTGAGTVIKIKDDGSGVEFGPLATEVSNAQSYALSAQNWAIKIDGIVESTDYSSKAWAIGGTGVTDTAGKGAAKEWAIETASTVDGTNYSAKEWAMGTQIRGIASGGSAKDWATLLGTTVDDTEYSAKKYANDAATSAAAAASAAAASQWKDVVYVTFADSPVAIADGDSGKLYSVDASGGVVVFNLPAISGLTLSNPWSIGIKKTDTSANAITINRSGTDVIDGATSKSHNKVEGIITLIPDTDGTPDEWTTFDFGAAILDEDNMASDSDQHLATQQSIKAYADTKLPEPAGTGIAVKTAADTSTNRTIQGTANQISVANGDGVAGDPTIGIADNPVLPGTEGVVLPGGTTAQRSGTPQEGETRRNSDTNSVEVYLNGSWGALGGGAGSLDIFHSEDFESGNGANFTSGNNATFDNGGTLDGTLSEDAVAPLASNTSLKYVMSTASTNDWVASPSITLDQKQKDEDCGITFYYNYNGDDGDIKIVAWDVTNSALLTDSLDVIETTTSDTRFSTTFKIPSTCNAIKYGFHVVTGNNGKIFRLDDVEISTNPFVYKNLNKTITTKLEGNDGRVITVTTESIPFDGSSPYWTSGADGSTPTNGNYYTVQKSDSIIDFTIGVAFTATNTGAVYMYKNGSLHRTITEYSFSTFYKNAMYTSSKGEFSAGDKIAFIMGGASGTLLNDVARHFLIINESWETEHLVTPAKSGSEYFFAYNQANFWDATGAEKEFNESLLLDEDGNGISTSRFLEINNVSAEDRITAKEDIILTIVAGATLTGGTDIFIKNSSGNQLSNDNTPSTGYQGEVNTTVKLKKDDYVYIDISNLNTRSGYMSLSARPIEANFQAAIPNPKHAIIKPDATYELVSVAGTTSYKKRALNSFDLNEIGASIASDQLTLTRGKYKLTVPVGTLGNTQWVHFLLYNATDAANEQEFQRVAYNVTNDSVAMKDIVIILEVASSKAFEFQTKSDNAGGNEYLSRITIEEIKEG